jgi:AraC-like DNA-binding protein
MIAATSIEHLSKNELFNLLKDLHVESVRIDKNIEQIKQTLVFKLSANKSDSIETAMESSFDGDPKEPIYLKAVARKNIKIVDVASMENIDGDFQKNKEGLLYLIEEKKLYLDASLTLKTLADKLHITTNKLSKLINKGFQQNFSEFVNSYRLKAFLNKANDINSYKFTILGLAFDCGFNSKTVFNTYFKKKVGVTPKIYLNNLKKS